MFRQTTLAVLACTAALIASSMNAQQVRQLAYGPGAAHDDTHDAYLVDSSDDHHSYQVVSADSYGNARNDYGPQAYNVDAGFATQMLSLVNAERAKSGLAALCANSKLQAAAQAHSRDMASKNYMSHTGSDGSSAQQRANRHGYNGPCGENVAAGQSTVADVFRSWMTSSGHRANILGKYTHFGVGYAEQQGSTYKHYWTQVFGSGNGEACDGGAPAPAPAPQPTTSQPRPSYSPVPTTSQPRPTYAPAPTTSQPRPTNAPAPTTTQPGYTRRPRTRQPAQVNNTQTPCPTTRAPTQAPVPVPVRSQRSETPCPTTKAPVAAERVPVVTHAAQTPCPTTRAPTQAPVSHNNVDRNPYAYTRAPTKAPCPSSAVPGARSADAPAAAYVAPRPTPAASKPQC